MHATEGPTDPRAIVTPDAFEVSPELLGLPLAAPGRRLAALLIDLVVIGILTALTSNFALVLGVVVAVLLVRAGFKRTPVRGSVWGRAMRLSVGCLGVWIGALTMVLWGAFGLGFDTEPRDPDEMRDDLEQQVAAALERAGITPPQTSGASDETGAETDTTGPPAAATDTVLALQERIDDLERENRRQALVVEAMRDAVERMEEEPRTDRGFFASIWAFIDELGFGFGWASLYMTILLSAWKGQTVGKRLLGIRVRRLDGEPITWWLAFERAGGYAAGLATGLLGFAQVYWDANRQAIHDRIAGTVVVVDGAEPVGDWSAALP